MNLRIETERLSLSPLTEADSDFCVELFSDERVMKYLWEIETESEIRESMSRITKRACDGAIGVWLVSDLLTGELYGTAVILPLPIDQSNTDWSLVEKDVRSGYEIEIGYILKQDAWGRGIATEIARSIIDFGFRAIDTDKLLAVIENENQLSRNVLLKSGLTEVGTMQAYGNIIPRFELSRGEWERTKQ